jgi:hypothetical protein
MQQKAAKKFFSKSSFAKLKIIVGQDLFGVCSPPPTYTCVITAKQLTHTNFKKTLHGEHSFTLPPQL